MDMGAMGDSKCSGRDVWRVREREEEEEGIGRGESRRLRNH